MTNLLNVPQYRVLKVDAPEHDYHIYTELASSRSPALAADNGADQFCKRDHVAGPDV